MEYRPNRIIWHHTADSFNGPQAPRVDEWHKQRGFGISSLGSHIGYHYLIEHDGSIFQARIETEQGAHTKGLNHQTIGIALAGNFEWALPTQAQKTAAAQLVHEIIERWKIPLNRIQPHRTFRPTACPGRKLRDNWLVITYLDFRVSKLWRLILQLLGRLK